MDGSNTKTLASTEHITKRPELLAPTGGREQFFAAVHAGADAVYLGLKDFNARRRAENFSGEDLPSLVAYASRYQTRVLVTLNVLLKEREFAKVADLLEQVTIAGVYAIIVQDLGLAGFVKKYFPQLRMHASTQLAIHNYEGVEMAHDLGFSRVVLAREMTILEISKIKKRLSLENKSVELEVFCHGSLCYSYSGLCFFSGSEGGRSGNRGECAYTCRKPYKILSESGHGFLFSMKDLSTVDTLGALIEAGVDTLKIEGRKKDAQYVLSAVSLYRQRLDDLCGTQVRAPNALAPLFVGRNIQQDLMYSFSRDFTSLFVNNRYHENVIDLNNPTHLGLKIGVVEKIKGNKITLTLWGNIQVYDGIRIESPDDSFHTVPQHGGFHPGNESLSKAKSKYAGDVVQFSLRSLWRGQSKIYEADEGETISMMVDTAHKIINVGDIVYKTRSVELKQLADKVSKPDHERSPKFTRCVDLMVSVEKESDNIILAFICHYQNAVLFSVQETLPIIVAQERGLDEIIRTEFGVFDNAQVICKVIYEGEKRLFIPPSQLKKIKRTVAEKMVQSFKNKAEHLRKGVAEEYDKNLRECKNTRGAIKVKIALKTDQEEHIQGLLQDENFANRQFIRELVFEPKRAKLKITEAAQVLALLAHVEDRRQIPIRIALPMIFRAWDVPFLKHFLSSANDLGLYRFEIANIGGLHFLSSLFGTKAKRDFDITSDFCLYTLNSYAVRMLQSYNISRATFSIEDDFSNIKESLRAWPNGIESQLIVFKDIPLFVAESCSLTALHNGCPGSSACGYRPLEIEDEGGHRYHVAHEACRSIVYGKEAFSLAGYIDINAPEIIDWYRFDFLTRRYSWQEVKNILSQGLQNKRIKGTHTANMYKELL